MLADRGHSGSRMEMGTSMRTTTAAGMLVSAPPSVRTLEAERRLGALDVLILSAWCGPVAGLLEVGARVLCRIVNPTNRLFQVSRHFVWLAPLTYLVLFLALGLFLAALTRLWPRGGGWLSRRVVVACALVPALMAAGPQVYAEAWMVLALGIAARLVPLLERHALELQRWFVWSFPGLLGFVLLLAGSVFAGGWFKERLEARRPLPPPDSPNVLLIVMDTVRADHMSLYGYHRATTPKLEKLAQRGILFQNVRATAPWTLASHVSMFTGRWPNELGVEWMTPLRGGFPTLAEYLGSHGYATAGFAANTLFCSYDTNIDRGFAHYEDYILGPLDAVRTALVVDLAFKGVFSLAVNYGRSFDSGPFRPLQDVLLGWILARDRISARAINQEFGDWLARRRVPRRPFFAFLNYFDAHTPYIPPTIARHRFGLQAHSASDAYVLERWSDLNKLELSLYFRTLARDAYDNCLAYLDEQLDELFEELTRRGELDRTLVIVTSDHGEGFGEHDLFDHGESLYRSEIAVPLLIVLPARGRFHGVVKESVSLRNLPATIVDLIGMAAESPFPGPSLAPMWRTPASDAGSDVHIDVVSELVGPNPSNPNQGRAPAKRGALISLSEGELVYIRNEGDGAEELFDERDDPRELSNRAGVEAMQPILKHFRARLEQFRSNRNFGAAE
jgi:arylsulfatase A-like enzyme